MDLSYATFVPAEKTPENPKGYIDGEFQIEWKQVRTTTHTIVVGMLPGPADVAAAECRGPIARLCPSDSHGARAFPVLLPGLHHSDARGVPGDADRLFVDRPAQRARDAEQGGV